MDKIHFMFVKNDQKKWLKSKTKMEKNENVAKNKQVQINGYFSDFHRTSKNKWENPF